MALNQGGLAYVQFSRTRAYLHQLRRCGFAIIGAGNKTGAGSGKGWIAVRQKLSEGDQP